MIVMVEGPAAAGKTSFVAELARVRDGVQAVPELIECDLDEPKSLPLFMRNSVLKAGLTRQLDRGNPQGLIVVDRGHASALAFAYMEEKLGLSHEFDATENWYKNAVSAGSIVLPHLYVYITAPLDLVIARAQAGGWYREGMAWLKAPEIAMEYYERFFAEHEPSVPVMRLDGTKTTTELVAEFNQNTSS